MISLRVVNVVLGEEQIHHVRPTNRGGEVKGSVATLQLLSVDIDSLVVKAELDGVV